MFTSIKAFLRPPIFTDDADKSRQATALSQGVAVLLLLSLGLFVGVGLTGVQYFIRQDAVYLREAVGWIAFGVFGAVVATLSQVFSRRGNVREAALTLVWAHVLGLTVRLILSDRGMRTPFFGLYGLFALVAGMTLSRRSGMGVAIWGVGVGIGLTVAEALGVKNAPLTEITPFVFLATSGFALVFTTFLFYMALGNFDRSLAEVRRTSQESQALQASLEQRVEERTRDLSRRARYLEATADVARYVALELDMEELLSRMVTLISERFGFYHAGIFLIDATGRWAELHAASSEGGQRMLARGHRLEVGQRGTVGYVTARGEARIALDVGADAVFFDNPDLPGTRSALTLPLRARGRIIGALDVQSTEAAAFTPEDATVLQSLADQLALAISNARLFERLQESVAAERRAYGELSYRAWVEMLRMQGEIGYVDDRDGTFPVSGAALPVVALAAQSGQVVQSDAQTVAIPVRLREGGDVLGVVRLRKPEQGGAWTPEQIAMMESITEQMGVALERARLYQDSQRLAMRERLVTESTGRMRQTLDVEAVLKTAADEIYRALDLEEVVVRLTPRNP
ncbi:MAG TPA: GAF domain-containing protein [Anaerolineae bacterium]|nr:GAF domain-containing protein [Anaerolineae bacterium]